MTRIKEKEMTKLIHEMIFRIKFKNLLSQISISNIDSLSGIEFEEFVANYFRYMGYSTVTTPKTGDNGLDIIASKRGVSLGIQAKLYYNHNISNSAVQEAFSGKSYYKCDYSMVITNWKFSKPAVGLAEELGVILLDRTDISRLLKLNRRESNKYIEEKINRIENER